MKEENALIRKRMLDMARRCYETNTYVFSDFLNLNEQAQFWEIAKELSYVDWKFFGGAEGCERQMIRFGSEQQLGYEEAFPIRCLVLQPLQKKFAEDLSHRDVLGALMHLGIQRGVLGDIVLRDGVVYVICQEKMTDYICEQLTRIRHTSVTCETASVMPEQIAPRLEPRTLVVTAPRCDSLVAKAYQLSRNQSLLLFQGKRVFVNGQQFENNSGMLKDGDIVSVRGYGKFRYSGDWQETKKGRFRVTVEMYG